MWAQLAWGWSIIVNDIEPLRTPTGNDFNPYKDYYAAFARHINFMKPWRSRTFMQFIGSLNKFDATINPRWRKYTDDATQALEFIDFIIDNPTELVNMKLVEETRRRIGNWQQSAQRIVEACNILQADLSKINMATLSRVGGGPAQKPLAKMLRDLKEGLPSDLQTSANNLDQLPSTISDINVKIATEMQSPTFFTKFGPAIFLVIVLVAISVSLFMGWIQLAFTLAFGTAVSLAGIVDYLTDGAQWQKDLAARIAALSKDLKDAQGKYRKALEDSSKNAGLIAFASLDSVAETAWQLSNATQMAIFSGELLVKRYTAKLMGGVDDQGSLQEGVVPVLNQIDAIIDAGEITPEAEEKLKELRDKLKVRKTSPPDPDKPPAVFDPNAYDFDFVYPGMRIQRGWYKIQEGLKIRVGKPIIQFGNVEASKLTTINYVKIS
jgi:hypothetical protein